MNRAQLYADRLAISLSFLCVLHCLALPLLVVMLPSVIALYFEGEAFHLWMIVAVIPTSLYALMMGCKQHQRYRLLVMGAMGLSLLVAALLLEGTEIGERFEKILTVLGSVLIVIGHLLNYRLCQRTHDCDTAQTCQNRI